MPLQLAKPPPNAYQLVAQEISRVSTAGGAASTFLNVSDPSRLSAALPHQVYSLASSDIAQARNLGRARLVSWRFLIQYGSRTLGAVEFTCNALGQNLRFASLDTGPFAQATRDAVAMAEKLNDVQRGNYELRVLKAPSVYVLALWLKSLDGGQDIVIPVQPSAQRAGPASEGGASLPQSPETFLQGIRSVARTSLGFDSTPPSGES